MTDSFTASFSKLHHTFLAFAGITFIPLSPRMPKLGEQEGQLPPMPFPWGARGARIALHTEVFPFLLSCQKTFSSVVDSLVQENFFGASPQTPNLTWCNYKTKIQNIVPLENILKTKIHPCGRTYIYIDVPSEEALPPPYVHPSTPLDRWWNNRYECIDNRSLDRQE